MVQMDIPSEAPAMETCVLIPEDFSLKIEPATPKLGGPHTPYAAFLGNLIPSIMALSEGDRLRSGINHGSVKVCAAKTLTTQTRYLPFSGTVRTDKLPFLPAIADLDVRHRLGSYDETVDRNGQRVRLCNWVRFVRHHSRLDEQANVIASRNRGSVLFEVIKDIPEGDELVVFLLPDQSSEDSFSLSALAILRSSIYRRTFDSIMSEAPLDLSRSLVASESVSGAGERNIRKISEIEPSDIEPSSSPKRLRLQPQSLLPNVLLPGYFPFSFPPHPFMSASSFSFPQPHAELPKESVLQGPSPKRSSPIRINPPKRRERTMLPCSECGKAFDRPSLLKRHMRTHTGEKPHVCDVCGKGFSTSSSLNTHRRIHSGEKPHQCAVCGKRFTASSNLYYHKMTHVKEKPHKCTLCTRSFPTPGDLRSHMFVHNGQWPHKCSVCGKGFSKLTNLRNHTLLHSGDRHQKRSPSPSPSFASSSFFHSSPNPRRSSSPSSNSPSSPPSEERSYEEKTSALTRHSISALLIKTPAESSTRKTPSPSPAGSSSICEYLSDTKTDSISPKDKTTSTHSPVPVSLSIPLHLQLSSRLAAISSTFPFTGSTTFPPSVVPSLLPLLSKESPFTNLPSPPLSPDVSSNNNSTKDREHLLETENSSDSRSRSDSPTAEDVSPSASTAGNNDSFHQSFSDVENLCTTENDEPQCPKTLTKALNGSTNISIANVAL